MYQMETVNFPLFFSLAGVEVGEHFYWDFGGAQVHGQVFIVIFVCSLLLVSVATLGTRDLKQTPAGLQNFLEYVLEFIQDIAKTQIGEEEYKAWLPYIGTIFLFIFSSNWAGALIPWKLIELPNGELAAPTNDINTTVALALLTSVAYFFCWNK